MSRWSLLLLLAACDADSDTDAVDSDVDSDAAPTTCHLVVTDIDETLTTLDSEFFQQIADASHDPAMRPDADTLMQGYADLGYRIVYVTARGEEIHLSDGSTARQATEAWLDTHHFPFASEDVVLAPGVGALGDSAVGFKAGVVEDRIADGDVVDWAYGNATSDIEAYQQAGIADDHIFLVGRLAGELGVEPVPDEDAYTAHAASQLPQVTEVDDCSP